MNDVLIEVKDNINLATCQFWQGAVPTMERIREEGKVQEFAQLLSECFSGETPTLTAINDLLWFEPDWVFEQLGIEVEND